MHSVSLSGLYIYPIKGARGIQVDAAEVTARGLQHDRRFMVVDAAGDFITQRTHPSLSQVSVRVHGDELAVEAPGAGTLAVPLHPRAGEPRRVRVWDDRCDALALGAASSRFFERALGVPCELVYMPDDSVRPVDPDYAKSDEQVGFADAFPFLLISQASLDDLNTRLDTPVPMNRFRPNLVVEGCAPFAEDGWGPFAINEVIFRGVKPCARCIVVTVDQETGHKGKEPLSTLARFRTQDKKVMFGQNLIHRGHGVIRVGAPLLPVVD